MITIQTIYAGQLRTQAKHLSSGIEIITDAPLDNHGLGEAFSPTDLLAASLGSCMLTIMGIAAETHQINMDQTSVNITKIMAANPRRVSEIHVDIFLKNAMLSVHEKKILENAAIHCPVAKSIHPDIIQVIKFIYPS